VRSGLADDLQYADVRDRRRVSDLAQRDLRGVELADESAPLLLGAGAARGHASEPCEIAGHLLLRAFDCGLKASDGAGRAGIVERRGDAERAGLIDEAIVRARFLMCGCHGGKDTYHRVECQG
jgi:hypothetical protein